MLFPKLSTTCAAALKWWYAKANAVFFLGGDQSNLTRDMLGTKLLEKVFDIYNNAGVIGGSSAGAAIMSEVMITGNELINPDSNSAYISIEKDNIEVKEGFGFLKNDKGSGR